MSVEIKNLKTLLNFQNSTSTFKKLIQKYHMRKKEDKHNKKLLLKNIEAKIQELENEEKENDYIISEVRRNAQINKEILYSFGTKALNHIDEIKKLNVTLKIDKSKFFEPEKESNLYRITDINNKRIRSLNSKYKKDKIINLPQIIIKSRNTKRLDKKRYDSYSSSKKLENSIDNKYQSQTKINTFNISSDNKQKNNDIFNYLNPINKKEGQQNLSLFFIKTPLTTDRDENDLKINSFRKRNIVIDNDYVNYIQDIKNKFLETEKRTKRYFERNKYGYNIFKLKYNYLQKKYFN